MVTSGTGGLYPPNIPVAIVVRRQHDGALARPLADPGKVDAVAVLRPYTPDNIEAQGRPAPAPLPAPADAPRTGTGLPPPQRHRGGGARSSPPREWSSPLPCPADTRSTG